MIQFRFQVYAAVQNIRASRLRSFLAVLGILVGTASVVAMVSGGELASEQILSQFKSLGLHMLSVDINSNQESERGKSQRRISVEEVNKLTTLSPDIEAVAPYVSSYESLQFHGEELSGSVLGVTSDFYRLVKLKISRGRMVSELDKRQHFVVLGENIYDTVKEQTVKNVIGQQIRVGQAIYTIAGVLEYWEDNPFIFADINNSILLPISSLLSLDSEVGIQTILVKFKPDSAVNQVKSYIGSYFLRVSPDSRLQFRSAQELVARMKKQEEALTIFLGFIGSISLLVGGIGVMNIMLVSVVERKREIGVRRAIGAKKMDIQIMFLIESVVLSLLGGVLGIILGVFISWMIAYVRDWQFTFFLFPIILGFLVSVTVGIFFGFYPAHKAAQLNPIAALRSE